MKSAADGPLFIGYGNALLGDDGAGAYVAASLRRRGLNAIAVPQLTPELADLLCRVEVAIFIDANAALRPGEMSITPLREAGHSLFEHEISPAGLLRLVREVYHRAPDSLLINLGARSCELGAPLSTAIRRAAREAVNFCVQFRGL